jgi:glycosyltransferase involved in cell wall biosynthesis
VEVVFGPVPFERLTHFYTQEADAFVLPSRGEGWGRPLMDAMGVGLPTIATNWSGNLEYQHEENAFLVRVDHLASVPEDWFALGAGHRWAQPSVDHLVERLWEVRTLSADARASLASRAWIDLQAYRSEVVGARMLERLAEIVSHVHAGEQEWDEAVEYFSRRRGRKGRRSGSGSERQVGRRQEL